MISGFCKAGEIEDAREYFNKMPDRNVASGTIMIDGYVKAGDVDRARCLFDKMPEKNLVTWSVMIGGYARNRQPRNALELYNQFKEHGIKPDETFILGIITAYAQLGILDEAESIIHDFVGHYFSNKQIVTSLIGLYAKCGQIERALQVFKMASQKELFCYSTMISAFANHGLAEDAIQLFVEMQTASIKPDGITFLGILTACNHGGLVAEGRRYFKQMRNEYGIRPSEKHYACIVDLLGRAGCLDEAYNLIKDMPISPNASVWVALLSACRLHSNVELAEVAAAELFKLEPENSGNYALMIDIYSSSGMWDGVAKVRSLVKENNVSKNIGSSWIE